MRLQTVKQIAGLIQAVKHIAQQHQRRVAILRLEDGNQ
jgi:hypothetical protein